MGAARVGVVVIDKGTSFLNRPGESGDSLI
ncbi:Uncharacterised protein [Mycobacterium tuberculosis]|uniref:Uncharacterized protein n=1 Tax=Mycobacterium tuberculosis TaxID=1773 RepID=A0A655JBR6_MYCTX|nr:Uncharacterised protein [Mycobacterium tuberculosis]